MKKRIISSLLCFVICFFSIFIINKFTEKKQFYQKELTLQDEILDDSHCFDETYIPETEQNAIGIKAISKGEFEDDSKIYHKNVFIYQETLEDANVYHIKPVHNSDYLITIESDTEMMIVGYQRRKLLRNKEITFQEETVSDGTSIYSCSLEKGKTYDIYVRNSSEIAASYSIQFEQDNWVYAPYGGRTVSDIAKIGLVEIGQKERVYLSQYVAINLMKWDMYVMYDTYWKEEDIREGAIYGIGYYETILKTFLSYNSKKNHKIGKELENIHESKSNILTIGRKNEGNIAIEYDDIAFFHTSSFREWNLQTYINKYQKNKRVQEYQVFQPFDYTKIEDSGLYHYLMEDN